MRQTTNNSLLPKGWGWTRINEIGEVITGTTPSKSDPDYYGRDYLFFKPTDLNDGYYVKQSEDGLSKKGIGKARLLPAKSVLVTSIGATIGKTGFIRVEGASNQQINAIVPYKNILPEYIYFMCIAPQFQKSILDNSSSTTLPILNKSKFEMLTLLVAPLPEQHRIVARLEELFTRLDAGVEELRKAKAQLRRYRQAVLKYAFEGKLTGEWRKENIGKMESASVLLERIKKNVGATLAVARNRNKRAGASPAPANDLPQLPEGWVWTRVGELSASIQYGYTAKATDKKVGPKFLRITDIQNNNVLWDNVPYCEINELEKEKYLLDPSDLVFARTGATVGKSYLIGQNIPEAIFASYLIRIKLSPAMDKKFVYNFFQCQLYWEQINKSKIGIGQPNVNGNTLAKIYLPLPPLPEQHKIVEEIERRFSVADEVEKTIDQGLRQAERLRQSILKRAFEGNLVPQDPTDEPAGVLLERIRLQRQQSEQEVKPRRRKAGG